MRLCIVQPALNAVSETFIRAHVERLPAEVTVIHGNPPRIGDRTAVPLGLTAKTGREVARRLFRQGPDWITARMFARVFRQARAQVVLAEYGPTGVLVLEACRSLGLPLVVHFHGYDASHRETLERNQTGYEALFREAAAVVVVSRAMQRRLVSLGADPSRVVYNPCGVDCDLFDRVDPANAAPLLVGVARFVEKKGPHLTLLAFERVSRVCPDARLRLVGDGPLLGPCQDLAWGLGIADRVDFLGPRPHDEVRREMQAARVFVQHSIEASDGDCEGTPVAILEAGASGLPVVATRHAGIPDVIVEGQTGLLVDERDIVRMAGEIEKLLHDPSLARELGRNASEHIRSHYSMESSIDRLWNVLRAAESRDHVRTVRGSSTS